jgi:hypothetical protein
MIRTAATARPPGMHKLTHARARKSSLPMNRRPHAIPSTGNCPQQPAHGVPVTFEVAQALGAPLDSIEAEHVSLDLVDPGEEGRGHLIRYPRFSLLKIQATAAPTRISS